MTALSTGDLRNAGLAQGASTNFGIFHVQAACCRGPCRCHAAARTHRAAPALHFATTSYHKVQVDGVGIFYREAGRRDAPTIVLLHGFPSSSRECDSLIPLLATRYHLIAPDYPGFGQRDAPPPAIYRYSFDHIAQTTGTLLDQLGSVATRCTCTITVRR